MRVISWAAGWSDSKQPLFMSEYHDKYDDMIRSLHASLSDADGVVTYNGKSFDNKMMNTEFARIGLPPVPPAKQIDLYRVVKKHFRLPSSKLEYVATFFGIGKKVKHQGFDLWKSCAAGCPKAWATMKRYNIQDVALLKLLYQKLLPWIDNHPSHSIARNGAVVCVNCGSSHLQKRGLHATKVSVFQRLQCQDCGTWQRVRKSTVTAGVVTL